jgi:cardiolipin synthase C
MGPLLTRPRPAAAQPPATRLQRAVAAALACLGQRGPGQRLGGVAVVCKAEEAFAIRAATARAADRTLDMPMSGAAT